MLQPPTWTKKEGLIFIVTKQKPENKKNREKKTTKTKKNN